VNHEKVLMAWEIGKIIEEHLLKNNRADYGVQFFNQLEKDISIARITLYQMRNFYKTYPVLPAKEKGLNWSHYRNLLVVKSDERRKYLEDLTAEKKLGVHSLQKKISATNARRKKKSKPKNQKLKFNRGVLFTYKLVKLAGSKKTFVDCGFNIFTEIKTSLKGGDEVVSSVKSGEKIALRKSKLNSEQLHTYKAYLDRVVDGDTIHVTLDLGFKIRHKEILRLAKINAPEAETFEGKKSSDALKKILADVPFLIVKTNKTDIYGRYVADVFLAGKNETDSEKVASEGVYLNQMLIDLGVAEVF
jgi:endonuclease YncB( thermonuclease family)